jgi:GntR family transcriptional regulator, carbon starvation induced regulator
MSSQPASGEIRTLSQRIEKQLSSDILFGRFVPDSRLRLGLLSDFYASGMSPLREALAQLVGKGLVIQDGQRGFRVAPVSSDDLLDVMRTRGRLETMALKLAIENGEADWEAIILAAHHRLARRARTKDLLIDETWETLHRDFHFSLIAACGSSRLLSFCDGIYDHFDRYRRIAVLQAGRHPSLSSSHRDIVDAVLARKADEAARLLQAHIEKSASEITILLGLESPAARKGRVTRQKSPSPPASPPVRLRIAKVQRVKENQR